MKVNKAKREKVEKYAKPMEKKSIRITNDTKMEQYKHTEHIQIQPKYKTTKQANIKSHKIIQQIKSKHIQKSNSKLNIQLKDLTVTSDKPTGQNKGHATTHKDKQTRQHKCKSKKYKQQITKQVHIFKYKYNKNSKKYLNNIVKTNINIRQNKFHTRRPGKIPQKFLFRRMQHIDIICKTIMQNYICVVLRKFVGNRNSRSLVVFGNLWKLIVDCERVIKLMLVV
eukprot:TRINITY_DN1045_c0_g1_i2.p2 TRINITY_DN1045_c0_g1~~TRINITY_DN1045_c0_g1_i2.p2  ORF type:complete len:225 (+),score=-11.54 TRINITY_DN1045_c0_g1_i2:379-1053(+)